VSGIDAELVEDRGAVAHERRHGQRELWHLRAADSRRVERDRAEPGQIGEQPIPQAHLTPDAREQQQGLALPADLGVDPPPVDA
jgi:hypothetical protein